MPVTKTAKRALRGSRRKATQNTVLVSKMEAAIRVAQRTPNVKNISNAYSQIDKAAKTGVIHANKASRLKSQIAANSKTKKVK